MKLFFCFRSDAFNAHHPREETLYENKRDIYARKVNVIMATVSITQDNHLETVDLIWLDALVNKSQENLNTQLKLQSIHNHIKTFDNIQDCEQFIHQTSKNDRICLIVSGQFGEELIPRVHQYRQIFAIYVYCIDKKRNEEWIKHFPKVKGIFIKSENLLNQIQSDKFKRIENKVDEPILINIIKQNTSIDKSTNELNGEFLYPQLLIDCLLRMKSNPTNKTDFIHFCRKIYQNNPYELNLIKEFEQTYVPNQSIWWYTRESFVYRLLNKALRKQNIDLLYLFRFFIRDIEQELKSSQCSSSIRVYRGQLMSIDELNQLKNSLGEYISINSFFSTSLNRLKAIKFLNDYTYSNNLQKILFEIDANPQLEYFKSFADISFSSYFKNEQEILFMLGSIFRLMNIKQEKNGLWVIQMILSNENDENFQILFNNIKYEYYHHETNLISFGYVLYQMGKYDLAEKYFDQALNDLTNNHPDISKCYHALGILALIKNNYDLSLYWHNKSLNILELNDPRLADSYNCIGCIYQRKEEFQNALDFYNKALIIWRKNLGKDCCQIADCFNNMGCVYEAEKNYSKALECHQKALSIRKKCLPEDHSDLGASCNNIGNIYLYLEEYDFALENYKNSFEIKIKSLPSHHSSLASILENIGLVYEQKSLYDQALLYYEKAAIIYRETFSSTHAYVIEIEQNIQRILSILNSPKISTCL